MKITNSLLVAAAAFALTLPACDSGAKPEEKKEEKKAEEARNKANEEAGNNGEQRKGDANINHGWRSAPLPSRWDN